MAILVLFGIGGVTGAGAAFLAPGNRHRIFFPYVVVAIFGALLGGLVVADALGHEPSHPGDFDPLVMVLAAIGAIALLLLVRTAGGLGLDRVRDK